MSPDFDGFPKELIKFQQGLIANNNKRWFDEHKAEYEDQALEPARRFIVTIGERLRSLRPRVIADPRTNRSIFRIYRDTRFGNDKRPYKTHLGLYFWEGEGPRMECPGYYFQLDPDGLLLASGLYMFPKRMIGPFRDAAVDKKRGASLRRVIDKILSARGCELGGVHYKKTPRGYDPDHPNAPLLLHDGLYAFYSAKLVKELWSPRIIDYCEARFAAMTPLHQWLVEFVASIEQG